MQSNNGNKAINQSAFPLNKLDYFLLLILVIVISWLYYRSAIGVNYQWHWAAAFDLIFTSRRDGSLPYFFQGLISTLRLTGWGLLFALLAGTLIGIARHSQFALLRTPAVLYIQLIRNIPPLVFIFIFYFFVSNQLIPLLGLEHLLRQSNHNSNAIVTFLFGPRNLWENLLSGVFCIGLLSAAYIAEVVRSGLEGIDKGQWEAAQTLGLSTWAKYRFVIAPQVISNITPPLAGQTISLVKDSSIVSLISIQELTFSGTEIANSSGFIFEIWIFVGIAYLILCLSLSLLFSKIESKSRKYLVK